MNRAKAVACFCVFSTALTIFAGCASNRPERGTMVGGAGGSAVGVAPSSSSGNAGRGAVIGGAVGLIGAEQDDKRPPDVRRQPMTQNEVITMVRDGKNDDSIIQRIINSATVFRLTPDDESYLRDKGVSDRIIRAMRETLRR
jgi:hypothetical protein